MLNLSKLPQFTIWHAGTREPVHLSDAGDRVQWLCNLITERFPAQKRIGLVYQTSPALILIWLALLKANKEPCILHYPTEKLSKDYWRDSLNHTIRAVHLQGLIHDPGVAAFQPAETGSVSLELPPDAIGREPLNEEVVADGAIIQLSSGTTGHKKGVRLSLEQLSRHVSNYNRVMKLGADDTVVSWLPLYHDMGFIACFVMPLMLGVPVVMIDPMTWVKRPESLFEAIREHRGTVCYLPNFGFEVMARVPVGESLESVRHWISCSEPSHFQTLERFCHRTGVDPERVSTCYGMAENIFAVSQSQGLRTFEQSGERKVSCGRPIPGTEVKIVDGEIYVKSDTSLKAYLGTDDVRDADGFYGTGDLGFLAEGEIVVVGRKRDLMISAGKKYFLTDLDFTLGKILPESAGRIASLSDYNPNLGTETALFLVERSRFWDESELPRIAESLRMATGLEAFELHFVPPHFVTKTSSGKINRRKTLEDWKACQVAKDQCLLGNASGRNNSERFLGEVRACFTSLPEHEPLGEVLDSLGTVMMRLICAEHQIDFDAKASLTSLVGQTRHVDSRGDQVFSIVAIVDGARLGFGKSPGFVDEQFIAEISREFGVPVRVEQLCVPPVSILHSDIIFHDFFMPRDASPKYQPLASVIRKIKQASLLLLDDEDAFRLRDYCVYPRLSHRFASDPQADLLGHRLAIYTRNHHLLAREVVPGKDIPLESITESIGNLESYLSIPIMKLAFHGRFHAYTKSWDYTEYQDYTTDAGYESQPAGRRKIQEAIHDFIRRRKPEMRVRPGLAAKPLTLAEQPHFCSFLMNRAAVDFVADKYETFCIGGLPSSLHYLETRLRQLGKRYWFSTTLSPAREDFDCMVLTGFFGKFRLARPYYDFMHAGDEAGNGDQGGRPHNVSAEIEAACPNLVAGDPDLIDAFVQVQGYVPVGNLALNLEAGLRAAAAERSSPSSAVWNGITAAWNRYALGLVYMENQKFAEAAEQFNGCIALCRNSWRPGMRTGSRCTSPNHALALCLAELDRCFAADQQFKEALRAVPLSRHLRFDYAQFLARTQRSEEALRILFALVNETPADLEVWVAGGAIALSRPEFMKVARDWTQEAVRHHPDDESVQRQHAEALYSISQGQPIQATCR